MWFKRASNRTVPRCTTREWGQESGKRERGTGLEAGLSSVSDQKLPPPCVSAIIREEDHNFSRLSQKSQDVPTSRSVTADDPNSFAAAGRSSVLPSPETPGAAATVEVAARPWVSLFLFGRKASALLDSGAQTSVISISFLTSAEHEMQMASVGLSALGNNGIPVVGETCAEFPHESAPKKIFKHPVLVTENLEYDMVLGMDFLRSRSDVSFELFGGEKLYMGDLPPFEVWYDDGLKSTKTPLKADVPTESSKDLPPIDLEKVISDVPQEMKGEYVRLLGEFGDLWSRGRFDLGELKVGGKPYEVTIPTETSVPIRWQQDRIPYHQREDVKKELDAMQSAGIIQPSHSPWAAPVVLVKKPDGSTRFCLDFRRLNAATKRDLFPLPRIQETLDKLAGSSVFSTLDYTSGF
eukprot:Cvel_33489.t1-p1 / transcript=Cvel_33489.t1 / gene=Cvel_33489 / organism=Chromera_velia_CCMP2878 / gene_product=Transposon Ty3-I Gag-Pol polyprotein, putative / transcript_product=Transposon Ty3-I Gag-Pol polyprotein, putative / location=Cvel_scaffold5452:3592-5312(+) / protein_length=408 / sequence_SO=supercontig / SO=protein_coding / is_pseudo=false